MRDVRSILLLVVLLACFVGVSVRAGFLSLGVKVSEEASPSVQIVRSKRSEIFDRNGVMLAVDTPVQSVSANPQDIWDAAAAAKVLSAISESNEDTLRKRLEDKTKQFVWIARDITPAQKATYLQSGVESLAFVTETKRTYPNGRLLGHVLGYTGVDDTGLAGLEYALDSAFVSEAPDGSEASEDNANVYLTVDSRVQALVETQLINGLESYGAKAGAAVLLDNDGAILALASAPVFAPSLARTYPVSALNRINQATASVYELGSVMKPLTIAYALEQGVVETDSIFPTARPYALGRYNIKDSHPVGAWSSLKTIIQESSNIGTLHVYSQMGQHRIREMITKLGLDVAIRLPIPELATPLLPEYWNEVSAGSIAYGHGISLSPLHLAAAYTVFTNDGVRRDPYLIKGMPPNAGNQVYSPSVTRIMQGWLGAVVSNGTGKRADTSGYEIGGKTGTADVAVDGGYDTARNIASFAAIFPLDNPRFVLFVTLVEPQARAGEGGAASWNAAPMAANMIKAVGPLLGVYATELAEVEQGL